jgi:hypothetical protein
VRQVQFGTHARERTCSFKDTNCPLLFLPPIVPSLQLSAHRPPKPHPYDRITNRPTNVELLAAKYATRQTQPTSATKSACTRHSERRPAVLLRVSDLISWSGFRRHLWLDFRCSSLRFTSFTAASLRAVDTLLFSKVDFIGHCSPCYFVPVLYF